MKSAYNVYFTLYSNYNNIVFLLRGRRPWDFEMAEILPIRRKTPNSKSISTYRGPGAEIPGYATKNEWKMFHFGEKGAHCLV